VGVSVPSAAAGSDETRVCEGGTVSLGDIGGFVGTGEEQEAMKRKIARNRRM